MRAYVLVKAEGVHLKEAVENLRAVEGVLSVDLVTGPYDMVVVVEAPTTASLGDLVLRKIGPIPGVKRTLTCVCV